MSTTSENDATSVAASTIKSHLKTLRKAIRKDAPYTAGVHHLKPEELAIYYSVDGDHPREINLGNASKNELQDLAAACQKATFGLNQEDVLDETYRKAGKMDLDKFATRLDVLSSGLLAAIRPTIMQGQAEADNKTLIAELYKLNVYGPGSFFKAHQDTPRSDTMIGSLVIAFPTPHEGGELTLEHDETVWTFDSAAKIAQSAHPSSSVAYVAFYSDVIHTVEPVKSGYRVTLTYNLFLRDEAIHSLTNGGTRVLPAHHPDRLFDNTLRTLLADEEFLPNGGLLGFGLTHRYPIPSDEKHNRIEPLLKLLKGSDARIRSVAEDVGLSTKVKIVYDTYTVGYSYTSREDAKDILANDVINLDDWNEEVDGPLEEALESHGVVLSYDDEDDSGDATDETRVHWVVRFNRRNIAKSRYIGQGNEASMQFVYGSAALFVEVPAVGRGVRAVGHDDVGDEGEQEVDEGKRKHKKRKTTHPAM
ncbi:Fe2OG dioxygenase domain-containing protein [Favolaschia claudopus]|uniref:Fe2OG dioxygenase domain-containing protein n=1 Tax=Favolaschia claudopus TaxID=2862362 RepID=A0AAV9ZKX3_9AGAR